MAEGGMLLFPGLKTGYQNSGFQQKKSDTQKQRDTPPKDKAVTRTRLRYDTSGT